MLSRKLILAITVLLYLSGDVWGYCVTRRPVISIDGKAECPMVRNLVILQGKTKTFGAPVCEKCTCLSSGLVRCCGYWKKAGVYRPPPGCRIVDNPLSCELKMRCAWE